MPLALRDGATALKAKGAGVAGVGLAQVGVPRDSDKRLVFTVTLAGGDFGRHATTITRRDQRYLCTFAYRLDGGDEEAAELALMDAVDAFATAVMGDPTLGQVCRGVELEFGLADAPEYLVQHGKTWREYPVIATLRQYGAFSAA